MFPARPLSVRSGAEVAVQDLAVGERVLTLSGQIRPITWIGTGQVVVSRGRRSAATPVIVRKGALADHVPDRDLRVTKGHSFYFDGALIPIEYLVNHRSILWDDRAQEVELYHLERRAMTFCWPMALRRKAIATTEPVAVPEWQRGLAAAQAGILWPALDRWACGGRVVAAIA